MYDNDGQSVAPVPKVDEQLDVEKTSDGQSFEPTSKTQPTSKKTKQIALALSCLVICVGVGLMVWAYAVFGPSGNNGQAATSAQSSATTVASKIEASTSSDAADASASASGNQATQQGSATAPQAASVPQQSTCTIAIECTSVLGRLNDLSPSAAASIPANGVLLAQSTLSIPDGATAFDVLKDACSQAGINLNYSGGAFGAAVYVRTIGGLTEFDCGPQSGWIYSINGQTPFTSSSNYKINPGDSVLWFYSCGD